MVKKMLYEDYLKSLSDSDLVFIRNRVRWECERRIKDKELKK